MTTFSGFAKSSDARSDPDQRLSSDLFVRYAKALARQAEMKPDEYSIPVRSAWRREKMECEGL